MTCRTGQKLEEIVFSVAGKLHDFDRYEVDVPKVLEAVRYVDEQTGNGYRLSKLLRSVLYEYTEKTAYRSMLGYQTLRFHALKHIMADLQLWAEFALDENGSLEQIQSGGFIQERRLKKETEHID